MSNKPYDTTPCLDPIIQGPYPSSQYSIMKVYKYASMQVYTCLYKKLNKKRERARTYPRLRDFLQRISIPRFLLFELQHCNSAILTLKLNRSVLSFSSVILASTKMYTSHLVSNGHVNFLLNMDGFSDLTLATYMVICEVEVICALL